MGPMGDRSNPRRMSSSSRVALLADVEQRIRRDIEDEIRGLEDAVLGDWFVERVRAGWHGLVDRAVLAAVGGAHAHGDTPRDEP